MTFKSEQRPQKRLQRVCAAHQPDWHQPTALRRFFRFMAAACLIVATTLLGACATLNKADCESGQWQEIGYKDGARGHVKDVFLGLHNKACAKHGVAVDQSVYEKGYEVGVADFCQPATGYRLGRNEENYNYVCPVNLQRDFLVAYTNGLNDTLRELESYEHYLEDRLWYAKWRHRTYERSYDIDAPAGQVSPNEGEGTDRHYIVVEHRVLDALKDRIGDYRDRRIRVRNALARAVRVLEATRPEQPASPASSETAPTET